MAVGAQFLAGQGFGIARDAVVSANLSAHVERLGEEHRADRHIARVGFEVARQFAAGLVEPLTQGAGRLLCALHERSEVGMSGEQLPDALHHLG